MNLVTAQLEDNPQLIDFYAQLPLPGSVELACVRHGDFFNLYKIQTSDYKTFLLRDRFNQINGLGSLLFRKTILDQQETNIGYATDLRIAPSRAAILNWAKYFLPILENQLKEHECKYIFSVVNQEENKTYNTFIRPRFNNKMPRYFLFRKFDLVTLHGKLPFISEPLKSLTLRTADQRDVESMVHYLMKKSENRPLNYIYRPENFLDYLENWLGLNIDDFVLALDSSQNIVGTVAPWNSSSIHTLVVKSYHGFSQTVYSALKLMSYLGLMRPLARVGRALNFKYLTHFFADNPDIFHALLVHSYDRCYNKEFLAYIHFRGDYQSIPPRSFASAAIPFALYTILPPSETLPEFLKPRLMAPPPILEAALL